jgi:hypothetical protein
LTLRRVTFDALLWGLVLTGLLLPALSAVGSPLFGTVSLVVAAAGLSVGIVLAVLVPLGTVRSALLCAILLWFYVYFYHWELLVRLPVFLLTSVVAAFAISILLRRKILAIFAIALVAGAVGAELERPPMISVHNYPTTAPRSDGPTVIHLLMDEFGSPAGLPKELFTDAQRDAVADFYVRRGFHVYEGAYSADGRTWQSVPRVLNFGPTNLEGLVDQKGLYDGQIKRAAAFEEISGMRRLHVMANEFIDLTPAIKGVSNLASFTEYRILGFSFDATASQLPFMDRLKITFALVSHSIRNRGVPLYVHLTNDTEFGRQLKNTVEVVRQVHPVTGMTLFSLLGDRIRNTGQRGEYYFAHLMLPHSPYVFNPECRVRPAADWLVQDSRPDVDTLQTRAQRYRLYYEQVLCTNRIVGNFLDAIEQNLALSDTVVIIHGDHGSRISLRDPEMWAGTGYGEEDFRRDWHATFFAVRIPGKSGGRSSEPAVIHDLYEDLVKSDFTTMPLTSGSVAAEKTDFARRNPLPRH